MPENKTWEGMTGLKTADFFLVGNMQGDESTRIN